MPRMQDFLSLVKVSHTIFSLPFAMIGFFLAYSTNDGNISFRILLLVILSILFARNSAMGFNRYIDRDFDGKNPRTASREIPGKIITPRAAMLFVILNAILFVVTAGLINRLCLALSPVALAVILGYSFTKRFTFLSHLFLGLGLALAPVGAFLAVTSRFEMLPVLFSTAVLLWVAGFDIIYALQDIEFDRSENLRSLPARLGVKNSLIVSALLHVLALGMLVLAGFMGLFHPLYWTGLLIFTLLICYQHVIVRPSDLSKVNMAFATMNGIASLIFAVFVIMDLYFKM